MTEGPGDHRGDDDVPEVVTEGEALEWEGDEDEGEDEAGLEIDIDVASIGQRPWSPEAPQAGLWLTAGAVVGFLGGIYGPLVLLALEKLTAQEAESLILRLWGVSSTLVLAAIANYWYRGRR